MEKRQNVGTKSAFTPKKKNVLGHKTKTTHLLSNETNIFLKKKKNQDQFFCKKIPKVAKLMQDLAKEKFQCLWSIGS